MICTSEYWRDVEMNLNISTFQTVGLDSLFPASVRPEDALYATDSTELNANELC
jgi:hypothetical protein